MKTRIYLLFGICSVGAALFLTFFVSPAATLTPIFNEESVAAGVTGDTTALSQYWSVGQAWGDADGDGWLDLYITSHLSGNSLHINNQDGTFSLSPHNADVALAANANAGASFADFDNDGDKDLYVTALGANTLFRNDGAAGFADITVAAGVGDTGEGDSVSWGDYDNDGYLDIYIANYAEESCPNPYSCPGNTDILYHNEGNGTFTNVTASIGGATPELLWGSGFIATFVDYDNDNDLDIYVINDRYRNSIGNQLFQNDGPPENCSDAHWCWTEVSRDKGLNSKVCGMGLGTVDYDKDGDLDFYFTNHPACKIGGVDGYFYLMSNQEIEGNPKFVNESAAAGVDVTEIGWGTEFIDYDNDGWFDIYVAMSQSIMPVEGLESIVFHSDGDGTFTDVSALSGADDDYGSWGVAYADYNRDGWVDLVTTNMDEAAPNDHRLYKNQSSIDNPGNHWLAIEMVGGGPVNLDAVGARATVVTTGGSSQLQEVRIGSGLGGGSTTALHYGLGASASKVSLIDHIDIRWPDGCTHTLTNIDHDQYITVTYSAAICGGTPTAVSLDAMTVGAEPMAQFNLGTVVWAVLSILTLSVLFLYKKLGADKRG